MNKEEFKDCVYYKIKKFVDLIDLNFDPLVLNARANAIDALSGIYKILSDEIGKDGRDKNDN